MVRPGTIDDRDDIVATVVAAGMFTPDDVGVVAELLAAHLGGADHDDDRCLVIERAGRAVAVAYAEARPAADRVWDLTMIGVRPEHQHGGDGTALIGAIEQDLARAGQRLMVVETSALAEYDGARAFYRARGYDEEARIRDYWADGDDLIVFRKRLPVIA